MNYLSPVGEPDGLDLVGEARVGQRIDPSVDESLLPAHIHMHGYSVQPKVTTALYMLIGTRTLPGPWSGTSPLAA
jgi:hypothetical protein